MLLPPVTGGSCDLLGSIRGPLGLPRWLKALRPLTPLFRRLPFGLVTFLARACLYSCGSRCRVTTRNLLRHLAEADAAFLRWGTAAALSWQPSPATQGVRVFHLHGQRDRLFPARLAGADVVLPGAGHLLSLTHGRTVNDLIASRMSTWIEQGL